MDLKERQAQAYLQEAELTLDSAEFIFEKGIEEGKKIWSKVVKNAYDAMEDAIAAAIAFKEEVIPKEHPAKISKFISLYSPKKETIDTLFKWLGKRSKSQYVDIKEGRILVPSELFSQDDAQAILNDCKVIINDIKAVLARK